jgi:hypothetical protein
MTTEKLEKKICTFKGIAKNDIKRDPICAIIKDDPKIYGYSNCLKCNGFNDNCLFYEQLKKFKLI